ncbi:uncharacterized protein LOC106157998 isoform X1 [Lingula anatina]|uniref:Uncharacterized protein LOC106157998 isoform X1 n=1 Tax=Lingula anatina TaxID=7574 RepID=A0A1S3HTD2_LINAN|nr:uncharacterized protein LOC106157998 isoform X1 [Lingula anatina]|eukprot:XP_013389278.1 uncharacterized protein LOC106157998 isoform X1 [Lingula anatina]
MLKISKLDINLPLELVKTCAALADSQLCKFVATNEEGEFQHSIEVKNKEDGVISLELSNLEIGYESGRFVAQIMKVFQVFQGTIGAPQNYTSQHDLSQDSALKPPADGAVQTGWAGVKAGHPTSSSFVDLTESSEKRIVSDKDTNSHRSIQTIPTPITIQDNAKLENRFNEVGNNSRTSEGEASSTVSPVHLYKNLCSKRPASSSIKGQETMPLKRPCTLPQASDTITEVDIHETPESHGEDSQSNDNKDIALNTKLICSIQDTVEVKQELVDIDIGSVMQHVDVPAGFESSVSSNQPMWSMQPREHSNLPPMIPTWQHSLDGSHSQDMPSTSVQPAARGKNSTYASQQKRFTPKDDLMLLREVITLNPFAGGRAKWEEVVTNLNVCSHSSFNIKSCQARVRTLKLAFQEKTMQSLKASGTDEELTERESLLQELLYLLEENAATENSEKEKKKREEKENVDKGLKVREAAMLSQRRKPEPADVEETQQPSTSTQPSTSKRRHSSPSFEEYFELRRRQQELETQRFQHETQRLEQERARDEKMFAMLAKLIEKNKN